MNTIRNIILVGLFAASPLAQAVDIGDIEDISMQVMDVDEGGDRPAIRELILPPKAADKASVAMDTANQAKLDAQGKKDAVKAAAKDAKSKGQERADEAKTAAAAAREAAQAARVQAREERRQAQDAKKDAKDQAKGAKQHAEEVLNKLKN